MDRKTDLQTALRFVVRRIEEQAIASGHPLSEEERLLLKNLPRSNVDSTSSSEFGPPELVPRNINLERLCTLGKTAYLNDRQEDPASLDWQFAFLVLTLHRHPMWGLLRYTGLKYRRRLTDQLLLVIAALPFLIIPLIFAWNGQWTSPKSTGITFGFIAVSVCLYLASRRIQGRRLDQEIERCRLGSRFVISTTS
jgi:hypothetical protein